MDISIKNKHAGRIEIELFSKDLPMTCKNFHGLCCGTEVDGKMLTYRNSIFHRVIGNFMA